MTNVGVIGLTMGGAHLEGYSRIPRVKVLAICDLNETLLKEQAEKFSVSHLFSDYHKMLKMEELDAVSIALPNFLHCPVTLEALTNGKHVLVEKPMAMNSAEAEKMVKKAKEKKKTLAVAMNYRFVPERVFLKEMIKKGELGEIYYIKAVSLRKKTFNKSFYKEGNPRTWFTTKEKSGGGALVDMGPHLLDLAMWFCDDFKPVSVCGVTSCKMKNGSVDDLASALIKLKSGATISLEFTWESFTKGKFFLSLFGTEGGAQTDPLIIYKEMNGTDIEIKPEAKEAPETLQSHFVSCIKEGKEPEVSGEKGVAVMKIIDAVYESSKQGKTIFI